MRTKLCVLGAVLGTASVLSEGYLSPVASVPRTKEEPPRARSSRRESQPVHGHDARPFTPAERPASPALEVPTHPCELITVMRVPCDPSTGTCEYTYWQCPLNVKPLRA